MKAAAGRRAGLAAVVALATFGAFAARAADEAGHAKVSTRRPPLTWRCLDLRAETLLASAQTHLCVEKSSAAAFGAGWHHPIPPPSVTPPADLYRMTVETSVAGRQNVEEIFFDPATGAVVQRERFRPGAKGNRKTYRLTPAGMRTVRSSPENSKEAAAGESGWTKHEIFEHALPATGCKVLSEASLLFYLIGIHPWDDGKPLEMCIFSNEYWNLVRAVPEGEREGDYKWQEGGQQREAKKALVVRLESQTLGGDEKVELLGLSGDIRLFIDPVQRRPLAIQGQVPIFGLVNVQLVGVEPP
jgi:hypothetical protein